MTIKQAYDKDDIFVQYSSVNRHYRFNNEYKLLEDHDGKKHFAYFDSRYGWRKDLFDFSPEFNTMEQAEKHYKKEMKRIFKEVLLELEDNKKQFKTYKDMKW
jgi:hypothetical protein